jgi:hypothetical protein
MMFCLRLSVEFSFLIFVLSQLITINKNCKYLRPLLDVNKLAKFLRLCLNVLCFILALFSLQWCILLNRTRSLLFFYFRNGRFINRELSVFTNEFQQNIQTTFKMIVC